jgi:hypothetical protein
MTRSTKKHSFKPAMEVLETRWCPATTISPIQNGVVTITGDESNNEVLIVQNDAQNQLNITAGGVTAHFVSDQVSGLTIDLRGGDDRLTYRMGTGSDFTSAKNIQVDLGSGKDMAWFDFADNGVSTMTTIRARLDINVLGQAGNDEVDAFFGALANSARVKLTGNMGLNDDTFNAELKGDIGSYSTLSIDMEDTGDYLVPFGVVGHAFNVIPGGNDTFQVKADADVDIAKCGELDVTLKGFDGQDTMMFNYHGKMNGVLNVDLEGGNGQDQVSADLTLDLRSTGTINAQVLGGAGDDSAVALGIHDNSGGFVTLAQALLDGGDGHDFGAKTDNVTGINIEGYSTNTGPV